jgi:hypothetical protein
MRERERIAKLIGQEIALPEEPAIPQIHPKFEVPVTTGTNFIVGFVDVVAHYKVPYVSTSGLSVSYNGEKEILRVRADHDPALEFHWTGEVRYFEAKPAIRSLGELLRQVRTYQQYLANAEFLVVSPDTRFPEGHREPGHRILAVPRFPLKPSARAASWP